MEKRFVLDEDEWTAKLERIGTGSFELKIARNGEAATVVGWTEDKTAKGWRAQMEVERQQGKLRSPTTTTLRDAAEQWLNDA